MNKTRVVVYDSSIHMAGIAASLRTDPTLDVVGIHRGTPQSWHLPTENGPAVIVFDLDEPPPGFGVPLLRNRPCLLLIGVDQFSAEMLVLSCHQQKALAVADLIKVIHEEHMEAAKVLQNNT